MTMLVLGALLLTAAGAALSQASASGLSDSERAALDAADVRVRAALLAQGWLPPTSAGLRELAEELRASHEVEILHVREPFRIELGYRTLQGTDAPETPLSAATVVVADELGLYPPELVRKSMLRRVALCGTLLENGAPIPSLPNYQRTLLLDVAAEPDFLRRLLHHEVFHFVDLADDGEVLWDPAWERLNAPGFAYGRGGRDMREPGASALTDALPGFLTRYATSALEEDKAETFAFLMVQPELVATRAATDPVLAAKVQRIREIVAALEPSMNDAFWARIARHRSHDG
jgi:hypothetical protein